MRIQTGDGTGNDQYRSCTQCGADCMPEPFDAGDGDGDGDGDGVRVAFSCPEHGVHSIVDPFEASR